VKEIIIYVGDSFGMAGITDYEWLVINNIIDKDKIGIFDFIKNFYKYKKQNSIFKLSQEIKNQNAWTNRLANKLEIDYLNLSTMGASWQNVYNQILYSLLEIKNKKLIIIISCPINERIMSSLKKNETINLPDFNNFYEIEKNNNSEYLLNNFSFHRKNKLNIKLDFLFTENELILLDQMFDKKTFELLNLQAIIGIINLLITNNINFFFLPTWYETVESQINEISKNNEFINKFIISKIPKDQLTLKSPFLLKNFKKNRFSDHPSFESQEIICDFYYDFVKNKL
jgi:hypothetical protein